MHLQHLSILNFKNIAETEIDLCPGVNCLLGANGMGKSNLLEAVHFLSFTRPMRAVTEQSLIRHGEQSLMVRGVYDTGYTTADTVLCSLTAGKGKKVRLNDKEYGRISEHIGRFPVVTVSPDDTDLIRGGASERRRLTDMVISQTDGAYLSTLMRYNRALTSRNNLLRSGVRDPLLFESVETTMSEAAEAVYRRRKEWAEEIAPLFAGHYADITDGAEKASLAYRSAMDEASPEEIFAATRAKDEALGYTSKGIHRDDLAMALDRYPMRNLGSQGQMKTFTIALRMAIFDYVRSRTGITPLLLLDDIFDKLDAARVAKIIRLVSDESRFGQILITDTNRRHLDETVANIGGRYSMFEVSDGVITPLASS